MGFFFAAHTTEDEKRGDVEGAWGDLGCLGGLRGGSGAGGWREVVWGERDMFAKMVDVHSKGWGLAA